MDQATRSSSSQDRRDTWGTRARPHPSIEEEQYRQIFDLLPVPAWVLDRATLRFLAVNKIASEHFGYTPEALLTMTYPSLLCSEDMMDVQHRLGQDAPPCGMHTGVHRTTSGEVIPTQVSWVPIAFDRVPAVLMTVPPPENVRPLLEEVEESRSRLEALSWRLVKVQEAERAGLARELHDEIGQLLTGLKYLIAADANGRRSTQGDEATRIVNNLIGRIRDLTVDLRPPMLEEVGLVPTLAWYFKRFADRTHISVSFDQNVEGTRFQDALEITSFRIVQEALTNVARHAQVESARVEVRTDSVGLWVVVEDRGRGFDRRSIRPDSAGITGMQERARLVGGRLTLESAPGSGTRVALILPLHGDDDAEGRA